MSPLVLGTEIHTPFDGVFELLSALDQNVDGFGVRHLLEGCLLHLLQSTTSQFLQLDLQRCNFKTFMIYHHKFFGYFSTDFLVKNVQKTRKNFRGKSK
jgi:hypothetical protein